MDMQRVKLLSDRAGQGFNQTTGEIIWLPRDEAARLIAAGAAEEAPVDLSGTKHPTRKSNA